VIESVQHFILSILITDSSADVTLAINRARIKADNSSSLGIEAWESGATLVFDITNEVRISTSVSTA
jgi:hypothetical protein